MTWIEIKNFLSSMSLFDWLLVMLAVSLPYDLKISSAIVIVQVATWLFNKGFKNIKLLKQKYALLFLAQFFVYVASLMYSDEKIFYHLEKKLSLLVFPLILFTSTVNKRTIQAVMWSFAFSCLVASGYSYINTINDPEAFGVEMTKISLGIAHVYFGLYLSLIIVFLGGVVTGSKGQFGYKKIAASALALFFLFFMIILGGKMSIISLFLLIFLYTARIIIRSKRWKLGLSLILIPVAVFWSTADHFSTVKSRFGYLFNEQHYFVGDNAWSSIGVRFTIYKCAREIFAESPFLGTGIGDVQNDLNACYANYGYATVHDMNAHNQYVQILVGSGIWGLVIFVFVLVLPAIKAVQVKNYLYVSFLFLFALCCLTESLLERQQGVMFYAFFNSLLFLNSLQPTEPSATTAANK